METEEELTRWAVEQLLECGARLPSRLRTRILALGESAVAPLIELLPAGGPEQEAAPGLGWAPIHAVELLGELGAVEAVEPLIALIAGTDALDPLHDQLIRTLPLLGRPALEPALAALAGAAPLPRASLLSILARLGVRDDRILAVLVAQLEEDAESAANDLAAYGEPRALARLSAALDAAPPEPGAVFGSSAVVELVAAIEALGGTLTRAQRMKHELALAPAARFRAEVDAGLRGLLTVMAPARLQERLGHDEPCWCGSGRRYLGCCLPADEAGWGLEAE